MPDAGYLSRHNGDISHNKIENLDKDFDGFLIYSAWDGTVLFRLRVDHGVARKLKNKFIPPQISLKTNKIANSDHTASRNTLSTVECYDLWEIEYEEHCYYDNPDDTVPRYCDPPIEISRTWVDTICPGDDGSIDCSDPANFETAECGGGDGGGEGCRGCDNEGGTSSEIINNVSDTCLNKAVDSIINNNVVGKIKEIINRLGGRSDVHIRIYDAPFTTNGYPGQTSGTYWTKDPVTNEITSFNTNIILSQDLLLTSSQEHIAAVLIHEILHAYFRENTGKAEQFEGLDHQTMVNDYINPIAEFLTSLYGISLTDATAIAWDGVSDTDAYKNTSNFTVGSGTNATTISKEDLQGINSNYVAKSNGKGKGLCQE